MDDDGLLGVGRGWRFANVPAPSGVGGVHGVVLGPHSRKDRNGVHAIGVDE